MCNLSTHFSYIFPTLILNWFGNKFDARARCYKWADTKKGGRKAKESSKPRSENRKIWRKTSRWKAKKRPAFWPRMLGRHLNWDLLPATFAAGASSNCNGSKDKTVKMLPARLLSWLKYNSQQIADQWRWSY